PIVSLTQSITNLSGTNVLNFPLTILPNTTLNISGELLIAKDALLDVKGVLKLDGAHLYACSNDMWEGIVLQEGSEFWSEPSNYSNLIEDAEVAINMEAPYLNGFPYTAPNAFTVQPSICKVSNTIFNKNHI